MWVEWYNVECYLLGDVDRDHVVDYLPNVTPVEAEVVGPSHNHSQKPDEQYHTAILVL